jgi:hypothetical protein
VMAASNCRRGERNQLFTWICYLDGNVSRFSAE